MKKYLIIGLIISSLSLCFSGTIYNVHDHALNAPYHDDMMDIFMKAYNMTNGADSSLNNNKSNNIVHSHSYTESILTEPTCTTDGEKEYKCTCGYSYTEPIKATGEHVYKTEVVQVANCEHEGILKYTCGCGDSYEKKFSKKEHKYESNVTKEPTCTEKGVRTYTCKLCDDTYDDNIAALGHDEGEWIITKNKFLFINGRREKSCVRCGQLIKAEIIK